MDGVGVGEDVQRGIPVGELVRGAEAGDPQRRGIGEAAAEIRRRRARGQRGEQGGVDRLRIVAEQLIRERCVRPIPATGAFPERPRQLGASARHERDEIDRMAPGVALVGAACAHQLVHHRRQDRGGVLAADQADALERLVDEIQRVAAVGERPIGRRAQHEVGDRGEVLLRDHREQGALGGIPVPHLDPLPEPSPQRRRAPWPGRATARARGAAPARRSRRRCA